MVDRGDVLHVTGREPNIEKLAPVIGRKIKPTEDADIGALGIAIFPGCYWAP